MLEAAARLADEQFAPHAALADRQEPYLDQGRVVLPVELSNAMRALAEGGFLATSFAEEHGGLGLPFTLSQACGSLLAAANVGFHSYAMLTQGAANLLVHFGSEVQRRHWIPRMLDGRVYGTMCLSEPQAGSSLADITTMASPRPDGRYSLRGRKMWISGGEHELGENIVHLVLARTPDAPAGTKGISCFIVPKYLVNDDGSLGARNDVKVVSIEHKMGIKASPTCVMSFGEDDGAIGYLIGEENRGMSYMFTMMNNARLSVGLEGLSLAERAYQDALQYSQERRQGRAPGAPAGEMSFIIDLPDVRRMLLTMRSIIDALRAIIYVNAHALDMAAHHPDADVRERNQELVELLIPVSKGFGTDMGIEATSLAIQVYGGMGYIEESGVPQHFRDARITAIYEGTNGIQAMDLVGRKLPMRAGGVMDDYLTQISSLVARLDAAGSEFAGIRDRIDESLACVRNTVMWLMEHGIADVRNALAGATPFLRMFGLLVGARYLADSALAAKADIDAGVGDAEYLNARITVARFYCDNLLPGVLGLESAVTAGFEDLYAISNEAL